MYAQLNHEYQVKPGIQIPRIVQGFGWGRDGNKKGVFRKDRRNLAEIGRYKKQAIKILDEVNFDS